jgi:hypothetical protein
VDALREAYPTHSIHASFGDETYIELWTISAPKITSSGILRKDVL